MAQGGGGMNDFSNAIDFIFHSRESLTGGVQVGGAEIWSLLAKHLELSFAALGLACLIAVPIGLWLGHVRRGQFLAISVSNIGRAVPTLALIAFFIAYFGVGFVNVMLALMLLAIPPILTNAYVGVTQVDRDTVDAARGVGMTGSQIVRKVELPLALPLIFGGIRTSAVNVIATATIAPLAGVVTLGNPIINAQVYGPAGRLGAAIVVAVVAVAADAGFGLLQRAVTPRALRLANRRMETA
jgi:osmoprotectant transport system permease protein